MMKNHTALFVFLLSVVEAFNVITTTKPIQFSHVASSTVLSLANEEQSEFVQSRRQSIIKTTSAIISSSVAFLNSKAAVADDEQQGRLIEFIVENLNGEAGNSGRFVIKTHPDWAPNGVKR